MTIKIIIVSAFLFLIQCSPEKQNELENKLDASTSPYLRSAADQPVHWQKWDERVFELALLLDRPILLDIGAVWCHWCHVMDKESYENNQIADIINNNFIPVKVDRDQRPDIDSRYQDLVRIYGSSNGWPLTCFLTPEGKLFFGGTYFPPEDRNGRMGLKTLLNSIIESYKNNRENLLTSSNLIYEQYLHSNKVILENSDISGESISEIVHEIESQFDSKNGGFGIAPKFPNTSALELALTVSEYTNKNNLFHIVEYTLSKMASGGIYDHLNGGFHRYAVDPKWKIPHYEKLGNLNGKLLSLYLQIYKRTGRIEYKDTAQGLINYITESLYDPETGGFYSSQDADISLEDDGSYYTWSINEIANELSLEEASIFKLYYGLSDSVDTDTGSNNEHTLYKNKNISEVAGILNIDPLEAQKLLDSAKAKLRRFISEQPAPLLDKTIYADVNGVIISSLAEAYRVFKEDKLKDFALEALDTIQQSLYAPENGFSHSYSFITEPVRFLSDQVFMGHALLDGFSISHDVKQLNTAIKLVDFILDEFEDSTNGGFFDAINNRLSQEVSGVPQTQIFDSTLPSVNSEMVLLMNRLFALTGDLKYYNSAKNTLAFMSSVDVANKISLSSFGLALHYFLHPPPSIIIIGDPTDKTTIEIFNSANEYYIPGKEVYILQQDIKELDNLPDLLKSKIVSGTQYPQAFICSGTFCSPPVKTSHELLETLKNLK